jgi:hypothetical protein
MGTHGKLKRFTVSCGRENLAKLRVFRIYRVLQKKHAESIRNLLYCEEEWLAINLARSSVS